MVKKNFFLAINQRPLLVLRRLWEILNTVEAALSLVNVISRLMLSHLKSPNTQSTMQK